MKFLPIRASLYKHIVSFLHVQFFITLISMPILVAWGMPLSLLTFVGNFVFSPVLTVFLLLASLIFFCTLLGIPCGFFIMLFTYCTQAWLWIMHQASCSWLVSFAQPHWVILILIPVAAVCILHSKQLKKPWHAIFCYCLLLVGMCGYLKIRASYTTTLDTIACNNGNVYALCAHKNITIIDPGLIGRRISANSWCEYTLMPFLSKTYGSLTIDHCIVLQFNKLTFDALRLLVEKINVGCIYLPAWQGKIPLGWYIAYKKLADLCKKRGCRIKRIGAQEIILAFDSLSHIIIRPTTQTMSTPEYTYTYASVQVTIDQLPTIINAVRYSPNQ